MPQVLCFGTSLTSGYLNGGMNHWPYAISFEAHIKQLLPDSKWHVKVSGHDGGTCIRTSEEIHLPTEFKLALETSTCYDDVIVMVGTNDLAREHTAEEIWKAWKPSLEFAHHVHDVNLFLIELPMDTAKSTERACLNQLTRQWSENNDHVFVPFPIDIARDSDNLHFSYQGSTALGKYLAAQVFLDYHESYKSLGRLDFNNLLINQ